MSRKLYLFDFDGTITHKDSLFDFLRYVNAKKYSLIYLRFLPFFILTKLKLVEPSKVKEKFIAAFLKGKTRTEINQIAKNYFDENNIKLLRKNAIDYIKNISNSHDKFIVSASLDIWLKPFSETFNMGLICTQAEFKDEVFTGNFSSPNCNYKEKKTRIENEIPLQEYDEIIVFGDTKGDKYMYELATQFHHKYFG